MKVITSPIFINEAAEQEHPEDKNLYIYRIAVLMSNENIYVAYYIKREYRCEILIAFFLIKFAFVFSFNPNT